MAVTPVAPAAAPRAAALSEAAPRRTFREVLHASVGRPSPQAAPALPRVALEAARAVEQAQRRLDSVLDAARRGRTFTAQELLALQTVAYRYAQTVDLAARMVEHGAQAVKQAVNTQV